VGYLKGRWGSLRGLRVSIKGEKGIQINFIEEGQGTRNSNSILREDGRGLAGGMQMG